MQHPTGARPHVSPVAVEFRENVFYEQLVQLVSVEKLYVDRKILVAIFIHIYSTKIFKTLKVTNNWKKKHLRFFKYRTVFNKEIWMEILQEKVVKMAGENDL